MHPILANRPTKERDGHCILDCIFHPHDDTYYVLDMMSWKGYNLYDSATEFRFWCMRARFHIAANILFILL